MMLNCSIRTLAAVRIHCTTCECFVDDIGWFLSEWFSNISALCYNCTDQLVVLSSPPFRQHNKGLWIFTISRNWSIHSLSADKRRLSWRYSLRFVPYFDHLLILVYMMTHMQTVTFFLFYFLRYSTVELFFHWGIAGLWHHKLSLVWKHRPSSQK